MIIIRIILGVLGSAIIFSSPMAAQMEWRPLTVDAVKNELESKLTRQPSYATIWNVGYDFYRTHLRNQDTAMAIHLAYMSVRGSTEEENRAIRQAAIYWQKIHDYGITNVPVGIDESVRGKIFYGQEDFQTTLGLKRPKGGPAPYRKGDRAYKGQRRQPYKGRPDNPYPGPYYSGVYPP